MVAKTPVTILRFESKLLDHLLSWDQSASYEVTEFDAGEEMLTEVSCKFRPDAVAAELDAAGLRRTHWWTDSAGDFGLSLAVK